MKSDEIMVSYGDQPRKMVKELLSKAKIEEEINPVKMNRILLAKDPVPMDSYAAKKRASS